jgi:hypothetical protein
MRLTVLFLFCWATAAGAVDDPFARWTFDAGNGADATANGLDLTPNAGVEFVTGRAGLMARFDGSTAYLDRGASAAFVPGSDSWTIHAWILAKPDTSDQHMIVSWYRCGANPACGNADGAGYQLYLHKQGQPYFWYRDDVANEILLLGGAKVTDGRWHQLVGTYDAANQFARFYVDAVLVSSMTTTLTSLTSGANSIPLTVGRTFRQGWAQPAYYFHGGLDDVRLYRRALTGAEVSALYQAGVVGVPSRETGLALGAPAPNPARGVSSVRATLEQPGHVTLGVFDASGRRVRVLFDGPRNAGPFTMSWDGEDEAGAAAPSGVYFYRLESRGADGASATRGTRVILLR